MIDPYLVLEIAFLLCLGMELSRSTLFFRKTQNGLWGGPLVASLLHRYIYALSATTYSMNALNSLLSFGISIGKRINIGPTMVVELKKLAILHDGDEAVGVFL